MWDAPPGTGAEPFPPAPVPARHRVSTGDGVPPERPELLPLFPQAL